MKKMKLEEKIYRSFFKITFIKDFTAIENVMMPLIIKGKNLVNSKRGSKNS